jgi:hypothetical protein
LEDLFAFINNINKEKNIPNKNAPDKNISDRIYPDKEASFFFKHQSLI